MNVKDPCPPAPVTFTGRPGSCAKITWRTAETRPAVAPQARSWAGEVLDEWGNPLREDTALIVTELVTNAVLHGDGLHALSLTLLHDDGVLVEVSDASPQDVQPRDPHPDQVNGFGLRLVAALAQDWGHWCHSSGKTVWARLGPDS